MGNFDRHQKGANGDGAQQGATGTTQGPPHGSQPRGADDSQPLAATERLTIELARLRAKFGADPAIARASLDDAWMSPTAAMEEDEAEFIDAVADCLGVGLSLDAALTCWDSGSLFYDEDAADSDGEDADDVGQESLPAAAAHHHAHASGRRLVVQ
jgi:hypothetical protein